MHRDTRELTTRQFDVLVVGGGVAGAAAARESCLRGFETALVEREDFGSGASAQCFKVVHGGIRYLQHLDIARLRASCRERATLLRIAPHLVAPLPFVVPTYQRFRSGKGFLGTGMLLYDALSAGCNLYVPDPSRRIKSTRFLSRNETIDLFPFLADSALTGAAVFEDGQMYNPPRLVLAFAAAAHDLGAVVANYVEVERFLMSGSRVIGVLARDRLSQDRFEIRARMVINAAGPWAEGLIGTLGKSVAPAGTYSRDAYVLVNRKLDHHCALAVQGRLRDADAVFTRGARHLLVVPWRDCTLLGVWHSVIAREPDGAALSRSEVREFIHEINESLPALQLTENDVRLVGFGLVPFGEASDQQPRGVSFGKRSRIIDHRESDIQGLVSMISVRFTVARRDAESALRIVEQQLGARLMGSESSIQPLPGGEITDFQRFAASLGWQAREGLPESRWQSLARNYGVRAQRVLALAQSDPSRRGSLSGAQVTLAEVTYAVREEMAQRMTDVVFRRTELGTSGHPGVPALEHLQDFMSRLCGWTIKRATEERAATESHFKRYLATVPDASVAARSA